MTFLNPIVLLGLIAAAIPIILHLFNLRKLRTVDFSSLRFLKELQKTKMRRMRIRQLLLLLLRTLIVICLVLAFSRPALRVSLAGFGGGRATTTMVLVLDDSPSMGTRDERGVLFQQAKDAALNVASLMQDGDLVYLIRLSELRHAAEFLPARSSEAVATALSAVGVSQETVPFTAALGAAARILAASPNANREVYLITDAQATQFPGARAARDSIAAVDPRTGVFLIQVGSEPPGNAAVAAVDVPTTMITPDRPVEVDATVRNFSAAPQNNVVVSMAFGGKRVVQQTVDLAASGRARTALVAPPRQRGILGGVVELEDDALEIDNRRFFTLNVPEHIAVLLVGATAAETRLPALALTLAGDSTVTGLFRVRQITEGSLSGTDINAYDVVVLCGVKSFSGGEAERLAQFTRNGKGLMIFPGSGSDVANYDGTLFTRLGIPAATPPPPPGTNESFLSFGRVDLAHPLFSGLFESARNSRHARGLVESPRVYRAVGLDAGARGLAVISLSNGSPFLAEYVAGSGKVLLCAVDAGLAWSDFAVKGLFAPLIHRAVVYLAARGQEAPSFLAGETLRFSARLDGAVSAGPFVLRSPSGIDERIIPAGVAADSRTLFESTSSHETGVYQLLPADAGKNRGRVIQAVAVNVDPLESDLRRAADEERLALWSRAGIAPARVHAVGTGQAVEATVLQTRYGIELWKHFLALALLLAVIEMAIGREPKQEQS